MAIVTSGELTITDLNDAVVAVISQESHTISVGADGSGGNFSGASTTMSVYLGSDDDSANWTFSASPSSGVTGSLVGAQYSVSALSSDTGYVDITATRPKFSQQTKRFSLAKSKQGSAGPALSIVASAAGFTYVDGVATPSTQVVALTLVRQNATGTAKWYSSNGSTLSTDSNRLIVASYPIGSLNHGTGDTCYVTLANLLSDEQVYITAVVGSQTVVYCLSRLHKSTAEAAATRNVLRGSRAISGTTWSDSEALAAVVAAGGTAPLKGDVVTLTNSAAGFSQTRQYSGSAWTLLAGFFGGDILVDGTVKADALDANTMSVKGVGVFGGTLKSSNYSAGVSGWKIDHAGNAEMNSLTLRTENLEDEAATSMRYLYDVKQVTVSSWTAWTNIGKLIVPRFGFPTIFNIVVAFDAYDNAALTVALFRGSSQVAIAGQSSLRGRTTQVSLPCVDTDEGTGNTTYTLKAKRTDPSMVGGWSSNVRILQTYIEAKQFKR